MVLYHQENISNIFSCAAVRRRIHFSGIIDYIFKGKTSHKWECMYTAIYLLYMCEYAVIIIVIGVANLTLLFGMNAYLNEAHTHLKRPKISIY